MDEKKDRIFKWDFLIVWKFHTYFQCILILYIHVYHLHPILFRFHQATLSHPHVLFKIVVIIFPLHHESS